jgi:outer membrane protein OmpA-like peptidoglycan-associated protein
MKTGLFESNGDSRHHFVFPLVIGALVAGCAAPPEQRAGYPIAPAPAEKRAAPQSAPAQAAVSKPAVQVSAPPAPVAQAAPAAPAPAPSAAAAPPPPPPILPYDVAVLNAANALLGGAQMPAGGPSKYTVVIDPLIDGVTGMQSNATRSMGERLTKLIQEKYPQFEVQRFSAANVSKSPLVLIGTFTGVNSKRQTSGTREAYRICFALADLKTGKLVSKGLAFAQMDGVDATPLGYFQDAPAWTEDPSTLGYIRTCQGTKAGDPINPLYVDRVLTGAVISEAVDAYNTGRYKDSLELFESALNTPEGHQLRVFNGLYLANWKLGRRTAAAESFGKVVDFGVQNKRLATKFLFRPGTSAFYADPAVSGPYPIWLKEIASRTSKANVCLEVTGHTSSTGPEPLNDRLSLLRAEYVKKRLETEAPALAKRTIANGIGSRETLIGTGRDDASDALDRRVEFKVIGC